VPAAIFVEFEVEGDKVKAMRIEAPEQPTLKPTPKN
jgi:hypothetical protein